MLISFPCFFLGLLGLLPKTLVKCIGSLHHHGSNTATMSFPKTMIVKRWSFLDHNNLEIIIDHFVNYDHVLNLFVGHVENHNSLMMNLCQITTFCWQLHHQLAALAHRASRNLRQGTKGLDVKAERGQMCRAEATATGQGPSAVDHLGKNRSSCYSSIVCPPVSHWYPPTYQWS